VAKFFYFSCCGTARTATGTGSLMGWLNMTQGLSEVFRCGPVAYFTELSKRVTSAGDFHNIYFLSL
jgi:hypothetical protein